MLTITVSGPPGCGKSTFIKWLEGQMKIDDGKVVASGDLHAEHDQIWEFKNGNKVRVIETIHDYRLKEKTDAKPS